MQDLSIQIKADTKKAVKEIDKLNDEIEELKDSLGDIDKDSGKGLDNISKGFTGLSASLKGIVTGFLAMGTAVKAIDLAKLGADAQQSADAFESIVQGMGKNAEEEFEKIKEASKGLIPDHEIKQAATTALSLGVPLEKLAELMEVARVKSVEMGTTTAQAFSDLAVGIGRGSPMILDNLGLTIKLSEANEDMAKELNKSTKELTKQEKILALSNAVIKAASDSVKRLGDEGLTAKQKLAKLNTDLTNLQVKIGQELLPHLLELTKVMSGWLDSIDDDTIKTFGSSLSTLATTIGTVIEAAKLLNDVFAPDIIFGEGATAASLFVDGLKVVDIGTRRLTARIALLTGEMENLTDQTKEVEGLATAVKRFTGDSTTEFNSLQDALMKVYEANQKQIEQWNSKSPLVYAENIKEMTKNQDALLVTYGELAKKNPFKDIAKDTKEADDKIVGLYDDTVIYDKEALKQINKHFKERERNHKSTIKKLESQEESLAKKTIDINKKLASDLKSIDEDRFQTNFELDNRISELGLVGLDEYKKHAESEKREAELLSEAKIALKNGELKKYKLFIAEYENLAIASANKIDTSFGTIAATEQETAQNKIEIIGTIQGLENEAFSQKESNTKNLAALEVETNRLQMEAIQAKLVAERELLKAANDLALASGKTKQAIDLTDLDEAIKKYEKIRTDSAELNASVLTINTDTSQLDVVKTKVDKLKVITINGITLPLKADTSPADFDIEKLITKVEDDEITMEVNPLWEEAEKEIEEGRKDVEKEPIDVELKPEVKKFKTEVKEATKDEDKSIKFVPKTKEIDTASKEIKKPIKTDVTFNPKTKSVDKARDRISKPIIVPVTYVPTNSPPTGTPGGGGVPNNTIRMSTTGGDIKTSSSAVYGSPIVVPATSEGTAVNVTFNIDGNKMRAILKNNTIMNLEDYLTNDIGI